MINFKLDIPHDFETQITEELEGKLKDHLRRDGIYGVSVRIDHGQAVFSGPDEELKMVEKSLESWR